MEAMEPERAAGSSGVDAAEILEGLNDLLQLDHDAIGAYQIAIERLSDPNHAQQIQGFLHDHERHVRELNRLIRERAGVAMNEPHATGPFKQALQGLGSIGGDRGTLMAFRTNELQARAKYHGYTVKAKSWPEDVRAVIEANSLDEERHHRWVVEVLHTLGAGSPGVAQRAKEVADVASRVGAEAMDRAAARLSSIAQAHGQAGGARAQAAEAAERLAGGMGASAEFLRSPDPDQLRETVEEQVRRKPFTILAATFAVGFMIGRALR